MAHTYHWHDEQKTILVCTFTNYWTWEEGYEIVNQQIEHMATVNHGVHTIYDFRQVSTMPKGSALPNLKKLMSMQHPNEEMIAFVGANTILQMFINTVGRIYGIRALIQRYRFVSTLEEALAEFAHYDQVKRSNTPTPI